MTDTIYRRLTPLAAFVGLAVATFVACGGTQRGQGTGEEHTSSQAKIAFSVQTVASKLEVPWSIAFLPDGRMLVTERPGRLRMVENGTLRPEPITTIPDVEPSGESGLMGMTLHPEFASNGYLYLAYAYKGPDDQMVRVARYRFAGNALSDPKVIVEGIPASANHAGCRLRFGPDGMLYITTGDATDRRQAQDLGSLAGKILRLDGDGAIPPDNPFANRAGARPEIWSYGHRNPQGIDWQPGSGMLVETEHGPSGFDGPGGGDEVNIVERGANYGWPVVHHRDSRAGMVSPLLEYTPAVAPASGMFYTGQAFPEFRGDYFFGCLRGECIIHVKFNGDKVASQEKLLLGTYGRIREVAQGPDGFIYFTTSNEDGRGSAADNDDRILRLVPAK